MQTDPLLNVVHPKCTRCPKTLFRHCNLAIKTNSLVVCPDAPRLTEDGQLHRGLRLLVLAAGHALVDAGTALGGLVDDEEGGGFVVAADREVLPVGEDLLPARAVPVDLAGIAHHCGRRTARGFQLGSSSPLVASKGSADLTVHGD